jgi:hypothetical protein
MALLKRSGLPDDVIKAAEQELIRVALAQSA